MLITCVPESILPHMPTKQCNNRTKVTIEYINIITKDNVLHKTKMTLAQRNSRRLQATGRRPGQMHT
jgi:hypothetical protein